MPDVTQNPGLFLKVIFMVHFTLSALGSIGFWASSGYVYYNFVLILLLLWAIVDQSGQALPLAIVININSAVIDILLFIMGFPGTDSSREKFSVAMAILHLLARPLTTLCLAKIAFNNAEGDVRNIWTIFSQTPPQDNRTSVYT